MGADDPIARRLKAARALAGITVKELADRIDEAGLGVGTLGAMERGEREPRRMELRTIADACDLPYEFFTVATSELGLSGGGYIDERIDALDAKLDAILKALEDAALAELREALTSYPPAASLAARDKPARKRATG